MLIGVCKYKKGSIQLKLLLLGATGRVGGKILEQALSDQHEVTALVRSPEKIHLSSDSLTIQKGNVRNKDDIKNIAADFHTVISALNTDKNNTLSKYMPMIVDEMEDRGVKRLITIGTAGILNSRIDGELYRFQAKESKRSTTAAEDHLAAYHYLKTSNLDWTIVCPTYLPDGPAKGNFRIEENYLPEKGKEISVGDTADFAYSLAKENEFLQTRVGIAY